MGLFQARTRRTVSVAVASVVGSFVVTFVQGAIVACGGGHVLAPRATPVARVATAETATSSTGSTPGTAASTPAPSEAPASCGCAAPKTTASFAVSGDEKLVLDPVDAQASVDVTFGRGPGGKRQTFVSIVVRAYRADVAAERPTTLAIRVALPEAGPIAASAPGSTSSASSPPSKELVVKEAKDVNAYVLTWGAGAIAPRSYATVAKSALAFTISDTLVEVRGSLSLKDVATGRTVVVDKIAVRRSGVGALPDRSGAYRAP